MELKLFGKKVFEFNKQSVLYNSTEALEKSEYLPDFTTLRAQSNEFNPTSFITLSSVSTSSTNFSSTDTNKVVPVEKAKQSIKMTPKGVYQLKMLDDKSFKLKADKEYVQSQIQQFKDKLGLIKASEYDMSRGTNEIVSVLVRLQNRLKYPEFKNFFDNYAYTTTAKIEKLLKDHSYLQLGKVEQFLADMPKEAIAEMKQYTANTKKLCGKKPIFYIIADQEDFKKKDKRRDPILLAQSPFGHVWQIIGAWDEEMLFLEDL